MSIKNVSIQFKRGLSSALTAVNPVLLAGELCLETDTRRFKFGDGTTPWSSLSYAEAGVKTPAPDNQLYVMKNGEWVNMTRAAVPSPWA